MISGEVTKGATCLQGGDLFYAVEHTDCITRQLKQCCPDCAAWNVDMMWPGSKEIWGWTQSFDASVLWRRFPLNLSYFLCFARLILITWLAIFVSLRFERFWFLGMVVVLLLNWRRHGLPLAACLHFDVQQTKYSLNEWLTPWLVWLIGRLQKKKQPGVYLLTSPDNSPDQHFQVDGTKGCFAWAWHESALSK